MARSGSNGRPRRGRGGGRRVILAGRGDGWSLWVPEDDYNRMTAAERADLARRQQALIDNMARASTWRRARSAGRAAIAGAADL